MKDIYCKNLFLTLNLETEKKTDGIMNENEMVFACLIVALINITKHQTQHEISQSFARVDAGLICRLLESVYKNT